MGIGNDTISHDNRWPCKRSFRGEMTDFYPMTEIRGKMAVSKQQHISWHFDSRTRSSFSQAVDVFNIQSPRNLIPLLFILVFVIPSLVDRAGFCPESIIGTKERLNTSSGNLSTLCFAFCKLLDNLFDKIDLGCLDVNNIPLAIQQSPKLLG